MEGMAMRVECSGSETANVEGQWPNSAFSVSDSVLRA
jgi:hypothetical protein